ncbi:MAG: hypothetical protein FDZ70_01860 [Actinobacteria bacterium]|nr:MAG: hypothetical protein FDZ70_01860 [Actinomycetota bacterium]
MDALAISVLKSARSREAKCQLIRAPNPAAPSRPRGPFKEGDVSYRDDAPDGGGERGSSGGPFRSSGRKDDLIEAFGKAAVRAVGSQFGRQVARGILGTIAKGLG